MRGALQRGLPAWGRKGGAAAAAARLPARHCAEFGGKRPFFSMGTTPGRHELVERVPYTAQQVFDVVVDVDAYKTFLPFCSDSRVTYRRDGTAADSGSGLGLGLRGGAGGGGGADVTSGGVCGRSVGGGEGGGEEGGGRGGGARTIMEAEMAVGYGSFVDRYHSRIVTDAPHRVDITALDSTVFERLESSWVFTETVPPRGGGRVVTHVKFEVEYAVNSMAASVIDSLFGDIAAKQMRAFKQQCARRYGAPLRRQRRGPAGSAGSAGGGVGAR